VRGRTWANRRPPDRGDGGWLKRSRPNDTSDAARQGRHIDCYGDLDGLRFIAKIGIEKGKARPDGHVAFPDKNRVLEIITPDRKDWHPVGQPPPSSTSPASALVTPQPTSNGSDVIQRPAWSK
jgi:hypothetical protein